MNNSVVFWIVALVALVWNGLGCMNLVQQMSEAGIASLPPEYQDFIATRPSWAFIGFAVSVIAGLAGAVLLIIRSERAVMAFGLSCIGAIVATLPTLGSGITSVVIGSGLSVVLAGFWAWFARKTIG